MSGPFHIVALNPPAKRLGSSKGSRMAKKIVKSAGRRGKKFLGLSAGIVETGVGAGAGILAANFVTGLALERFGKDKPATHWTQQWWGKVALKVGIAVAIGMIPKIPRRFKTPLIAGAFASATLSVAKKFAPPGTFETRWGLSGDEDGSNVNAELAALAASNLSPGPIAGTVDSSEIYGEDAGIDGLGSYSDSAAIYARLN